MADAARAQLAPKGKLRAGMNLSNTLFTRKDAATGDIAGVSVDLMRELAARLGTEVQFVVYATPGEVADAVDEDAWDVAILAIEAARAERIAFSPPLTEIEATYAVHTDSALRDAAEVDRAGNRIVAPAKAGYELYLTRTLRAATLTRAAGHQAAIDAFNRREADALPGLKPMLLDALEGKLRDARLLEGRFTTINHGLGTPRGREAAARYLEGFVAQVNAEGFVARSIERHGVKGLAAIR
jgi:polar amino acid transport system substrate-binding protein